MIQNLLMLAQDQESAIFNLRNLIMLVVVIVLIVALKIYKNRQMND